MGKAIRPTDPLSDIRSPNAYRLTFLPAKGKTSPTDEWSLISEDQASTAIDIFRLKERGYQARKTAKREAA